jgi:hypothetical protein
MPIKEPNKFILFMQKNIANTSNLGFLQVAYYGAMFYFLFKFFSSFNVAYQKDTLTPVWWLAALGLIAIFLCHFIVLFFYPCNHLYVNKGNGYRVCKKCGKVIRLMR